MLVKPVCKSEMPVGSCTVWNMGSSLMVRCLRIRPLELVMTLSTRSLARLELESMSQGLSLWTWSLRWLVSLFFYRLSLSPLESIRLDFIYSLVH
jgi:hypothetical protein